MVVSPGSQEEVFKFLGASATHGGQEVRRIDTHANVIFLAADRAFKIKRAVRFPFLDYSTPAKRRAACLAELEVNQAFAPELYRRLVAITRDSSGLLGFNGDGNAIEWAVEMLRFDENKTLDRIAETNGLDDVLAGKLAATVAAMHARAPITEASSWLTAIESFLEQNTVAFRETSALFPQHLVTKLDQDSHSAFERLRPLLLARGRIGLVRRGHGDLHLGNIVVLDNRPVPFDAIEFDPMVATGDILYDLAFLLMDLVERGLFRAANVVLNGYLAETRRVEDLDGLAALPFFMSLRAAIRAKVTAARLQYVDSTTRELFRESAKIYFRLAADLLSPAPPAVVAIGGLSGTGKSLLAQALAPFVAPSPGALVIRSDVERKKLLGVSETDRLPPDAYRAEINSKVYQVLADKAVRIATARHSVIVDAAFIKPGERAAIAAVAAATNTVFRGLFLVADQQTRLNRIGTRRLDASDADAAVAQLQETFTLGPIDWTEIDASGLPTETLARARAAIG
jgi:aminoglycoside phosphotransferase family enzyme/predicted kinase